MSKPPAKKAAASKTAATKSSARPAARPLAAAKSSAKPAAKPAAKTALKAPVKTPVKASTKPAAKPSLLKTTPHAPLHAVAKPATPHKAPPALKLAPPVAAPAVHKPVLRAVPKSVRRPEPPAPQPAHHPQAAPVSNRFTDRFAPAKPMKLTEHVPMEAVKSTIKVDPKVANAWKTKAGRDLSEAELLAMPDSEYMKDKQLDFFRARLTVQKDDLLSNAGETTEHLREDTSIVPDPADRATIEEEHALELRTRDRERKLLKKIAQSLTRVDSGEYGYCDETGEPIGLARLMARPTATLSLEAQQRREMKQKMFGD